MVGFFKFAKVPFAGDGGPVPCGTEGISQGALVEWKPPAGSRSDDGIDACVYGIASGEECRACWGTHWLHVMVLQNRPRFCETINVRGLDLRAAVKSAV